MNAFEINKIVGAVLGICLFTLALNMLASGLFASPKPAKPGYDIAVTETPAAAGSAQASTAPAEPIEKLLASASSERGSAAAKKCVACHSFEKGGPNKVGPNLWDIVGRNRAQLQGFAYSSGLKGMGGNWSLEDLNKFLTNPKLLVKGTSMAFAGLNKANERADLLVYLNSLSDNPKPLPK